MVDVTAAHLCNLNLIQRHCVPARGHQQVHALQGMNDDVQTVDQFRQRYVEPMGEESDHVHIVALTDALQVSRLWNS